MWLYMMSFVSDVKANISEAPWWIYYMLQVTHPRDKQVPKFWPAKSDLQNILQIYLW